MRSDFINKRYISNKRLLSQTQFIDTEIIVIPEFDTFFFHAPPIFGQGADDRWNELFPTGGNFEEQKEVPIGLLNPWNDGEDQPVESAQMGFGTVIRNRTPTRAAMAFNLSSLPANAQITDAQLKLTVSSKRDWD